MIKNFFKNIINRYDIKSIERFDEISLMMGKQLCFGQKNINVKTLSDIEFKVFSQWGEDGIIEYLVNKIPIENKFFIEFGVENYNESNTRFLMMNRNWSGLILDGSEKNIDYIKKREYFWKYDLKPIQAFITRKNINKLIGDALYENGIDRHVGILSIDLDGVDYWILKEINCIEPSIIICEYNSLFGDEKMLTIPYDDSFVRNNYHYSNLYWGASLNAFKGLLSRRGYSYLGSNSNNTNAFFVKNQLFKKFFDDSELLLPKFQISKVRESRDKKGELSFLGGSDRLTIIKHLSLLDLESMKMIKIKDLI